jgi:DNA polymerase-1
MRDVHSSLAGPYAEHDVRLTREIDRAQRPLIAKEDLGRVLALEDSLIEVVVEMEANGAPLNLEKLHRWRKEARRSLEQNLRALRDSVGFPVNPKSFPDLVRLFSKWGISPPIDPLKHSESFATALLLPLKGSHPGISLLIRVKQLADLLSKFLDNYAESVGADGLLRYNLHQLRSDDYGTITGRFSSAGDEHGGVNVQQVFHPENQEKKFGAREFIIRELFVPGSGLWVSADAAQIEYRLFAGLAGNPEVLAAYAKDPETDFHQIVTDIVRATALPDATRKHIKNVNFAKVYGAGLTKIASMLGVSDSEAKAFIEAYDSEFPEVPGLIGDVSNQVRRRARLEGLGYVRTLLGRRRRYPGLERLHSGLNAHIQGTAADINKIKLRQVYDARKDLEILMRFTVHDELDGDIPSAEHAARLRDLLNEPALPNLRVPIRWSTGVGPNWADVEDL